MTQTAKSFRRAPTARAARAAPRRKLRFRELVAAIQALREEPGQDSGPDALDRRAVLSRLGAQWDMEESLLLLRGFDRAYRQVIEGV